MSRLAKVQRTDKWCYRLTYPANEKRGQKGQPVEYNVGGAIGLYLQVSKKGGKSWIFRYSANGKRRKMGLGSYNSPQKKNISLKEARIRAMQLYNLVSEGEDPLASVQSERKARDSIPTFSELIEEWELANPLGPKESVKNRKQLQGQVRQLPVIQDMKVTEITHKDIERAIEAKKLGAPKYSVKILGRARKIFARAVKKELIDRNPVEMGTVLEDVSKAAKSQKTVNRAALRLCDTAEFFAASRKREEITSRALEFLALTAVRAGQVRKATWDEIDFTRGIWFSKGENVKEGNEHRVPLSSAAIELLNNLPQVNSFVFPGQSANGGMSDAAMGKAMKATHRATNSMFLDRKSKEPATPHGFRSTFKDWVIEETPFDNSIAKLAMDHKPGSQVELAYRRGDMLEKRRVRISRKMGIDFARSWARVSRHRGQPFHDRGQAGRQGS